MINDSIARLVTSQFKLHVLLHLACPYMYEHPIRRGSREDSSPDDEVCASWNFSLHIRGTEGKWRWVLQRFDIGSILRQFGAQKISSSAPIVQRLLSGSSIAAPQNEHGFFDMLVFAKFVFHIGDILI